MDDYYKYVSSGGCERCDALEGEYEDEPSPPHYACQCEVIAVSTEYDVELEENTEMREHPDRPGWWYAARLTITVTVTCTNSALSSPSPRQIVVEMRTR